MDKLFAEQKGVLDIVESRYPIRRNKEQCG